PAGDIDLCVRPEHRDKAVAALAGSGCFTDLHTSLSEIGERSLDDLFARSKTVPLGAEQVRVLGTEDHLALLCIHLLKHGGWRPLWLCDISAAVESLPAGFNWDTCLGTNEQRARWIACTLGLAERLLQTDLSRVPLDRQQMRVPDWISGTVLYHWSRLFPGDALPMQAAPLMSITLRERRNVFKGIVDRWPDPITATFNLQGGVNNFPRFPYQLADFLRNGFRFMFASSEG
ncbi:MAG TPA: nucleotidyltransferase family protein, partial [Pyrinomonadaceae bacterium]|nr:nucleotidyltransferase family protein [Pyrinomonadaceae bacterium]